LGGRQPLCGIGVTSRIDTTRIYTRIRPPQLKRAVAFYETPAQRVLGR